MSSIVKCHICGCETKNISNHVNYKHIRVGEIESLEEYYRQFIYGGDPEELGKCVTCGKPVPFISIQKGYRVHCCHECSQKDPEVRRRKKENTRKALIEKYGVVNASQVPGSRAKTKATKKERYGNENYVNKDKYRQTCLKRYGADNPNKVEEIRERIKATNLERYGVAFPANSKENQEKIKQRNLELYGVEWAQQRPEIKAKSVATCTERYGGVLMGSPELSERIRETWKERYRTDHPNKNEEQRQKKVEVMLERYGVPNALCLPENHEKARTRMLERYGHEYAMQVPEFHEKQKHNAKGVYKLRYYTFKTGKTLGYLSNMERTFLEDCDNLRLDIDRGDQVTYNFNGGEHIFNVDFRINHEDGTKQLVEIKGTNPFYFEAIKTGLQEAKNTAAKIYSEQMEGYRPYLYLLNYKQGDINQWIENK